MKLKIVGIKRTFIELLLFLAVFVALFLYYGIDKKLMLRPQSIHIWRQTDCLSITQNYYQRDNPLWEPEIYNMMGDGHTSGKSAGEFPGLYYLVAMMWKIVGKSEFLYRLFVLLITFSGLYALFRLSSGFLKNSVEALFITFMLYTSVIFITYSFSFLPNLPSLSFVFIGWYFIWRFHNKGKNKWLWWAMAFFAAGSLLKVSSGISYVALLGWLAIEFLMPAQKRLLFKHPRVQLIPFLLPITLVTAWYLYAKWYNSVHTAFYTFNDLWPIWNLDADSMRLVVEAFRKMWLNEFFHPYVWYVTLAMWAFLLITWKKRTLFLNYLLVIIPVGTIIYLLFWFQAFRYHDYYYIELFVFFVLTWLLFFKTIGQYRWFRHWAIYPILAGWLVFNASYAADIMPWRYKPWMNTWYLEKLQAVGELEPLLREHGVDPDDLVISIPDFTINGTLYLMNQRGFTDYGSNFSKAETFDERIGEGAKYLVINDTTGIDTALVRLYAKEPLFTYRNVTVYPL